MLGDLEYLNVPIDIIAIIIGFLVVSNLIGEALKLKGILAPEFMRIRDRIKRKKQESEILHQLPQTLKEVQEELKEFKSHYDKDNIVKRDKWIQNVNCKLEEHDDWRKEFDKKLDDTNDKLDKNNDITISILINNQRSEILNFASKVIDERYPVTREQFNRIFKIAREYEEIIESEGLENGEVEIAIRIIKEAYADHLKCHSFIEDQRGY
jgi:predicted nuclease with TOPRIM domain